MATERLRIGIVGCGTAARVHLERLLAVEGVRVVGCADTNLAAAEALAARASSPSPSPSDGGNGAADADQAAAIAVTDHRELLLRAAPDALAIFTPHLAHYRAAMDALQADCHVFIEKPLSTNVQEAADIVGLARGRGRKVGVGHQYRLRPGLVEARRRLAAGAIGPLRLVVATLSAPWLAAHGGAENAWRLGPQVASGGVLADAGVHLLDALLWTTGRVAVEASAVQSRAESGLDLVTAATVRLADGIPATLAVTGVTSVRRFELAFYGDGGRLHVTEHRLVEEAGDAPGPSPPTSPPEPPEDVDANFVAAVVDDAPLCCPADQALETVRLLEAVARSAATGQVVRLA